jgi:hypothetical protein
MANYSAYWRKDSADYLIHSNNERVNQRRASTVLKASRYDWPLYFIEMIKNKKYNPKKANDFCATLNFLYSYTAPL